MAAPLIEVTTGSRLHFGLLAPTTVTLAAAEQPFASDRRQFGGVGTLVDRPGLRVRMSRSTHWQAEGPLSQRALSVAQQVVQRLLNPSERSMAGFMEGSPLKNQPPESQTPPAELQDSPQFSVQILSCPPEHVGLGTGTQLSLAVAAGVVACLSHQLELPTAAELASLTRRGQRSAIGLHGFTTGGLIVDGGRQASAPEEPSLAPLVARAVWPEDWVFVLVRPEKDRGLSGATEGAAFQALPAVSRELTGLICREVLLGLLPAIAEENFEAFAASLFRYGHLAGQCFAPIQGGIYAGEGANRLIATLQRWGVRGVVQSSWGPTVAAILPNPTQAAELLTRLQTEFPELCPQVSLARPLNSQAQIRLVDPKTSPEFVQLQNSAEALDR